MATTTRFGVSMEQELLRSFDRLIARKGYDNRSEAVRDIVREKLVEESASSPDDHVYAALVYMYDHHQRNLEKSLSSLQHDYVHSIISTTHVHVDHDHCLEVVLLHDTVWTVTQLADRLLSIKGVQHGKLTVTSPVSHPAHHHHHKHTYR